MDKEDWQKNEAGRLRTALEEADNDLSAVIRSARATRIKVQQALGWIPAPGPATAGVEDE
jgi:hypothetical protein